MLLLAVALLPAAWPGVAETLIYDRSALGRGEVWRLWSGHAVHLGWSHLSWNLAVAVPVGVWLENLARPKTRWFLALAPPLISLGLLALTPALARYAGLSALATGLVILLALDRLRAGGREPRWLWSAVLVLIAAKVGAEFLGHGALFASLPAGARVVPLAHLLGALAALGTAALPLRTDR